MTALLDQIDVLERAGVSPERILEIIKDRETERAAGRRRKEREKKRRQRAENKQPVPRDNGDNRDNGDKKEVSPHTPLQEKTTPPVPPKGGTAPHDVQQAVEIYHAELPGLPRVQKLTERRKSALLARLRDCGGLEGWRAACRKAAGSPFLLGDNDRGWRADFDFLTRESSFTKLMEGGYDRSPTPPDGGGKADSGRSASRQRKSAWLGALEELGGGGEGDGGPERPPGDGTGWGGPPRLVASGGSG